VAKHGAHRLELSPGRGLELVDDDAGARVARTRPLDQRDGGERLAAGLEPVIDEQNGVGRRQRVLLEAQSGRVAAVVRRGGARVLGAGEQASVLADRDEAAAEFGGDGRAEDETACLDAGDAD